VLTEMACGDSGTALVSSNIGFTFGPLLSAALLSRTGPIQTQQQWSC